MTENNNSPKISIIVPVYKVEQYLRRCLDSIVAQTFTDWECILIDDGSPDNSGAICDEYVAKDNRFSVIHQKNQGVSAARNAGLDAAKGDWVGFVDADDWIDKDMYDSAIYAGNINKAEIVMFGVFDEYKNKQKTFCPKLNLTDKELLIKSFPKYPNYLNYPVNKIFNTKLIKENNIKYPQGIKICEDLLFNLYCFFYANSFYQIKKSFYHYNHCNEFSTMNNYSINYFYDKCLVAERIESLFIEKNEKNKYIETIEFYKLYSKLVLILYPNLRNVDLLLETYPESNKYIWRVLLRFDYKILLTLCAIRMPKLAFFLQDLKKSI